jgi:hypothetical protein
LFPLRAAQLQIAARTLRHANASLPFGPELERKAIVILAAPVSVLASYVQPERAYRGQERARHLYWLASASSDVTVTRSAERELSVRLAEGYLYTPLERHYRGDARSLAVGHSVALSRMTARITALTPDGRPAEVRFVFDQPLESRSLIFMRWDRTRYVPVVPPRIGERLVLPREDFVEILNRTAFALARGA